MSMEIPAPKIVVVSDPKKDKEIDKLKSEISSLKMTISNMEMKQHRSKAVLNGRSNRTKTWY